MSTDKPPAENTVTGTAATKAPATKKTIKTTSTTIKGPVRSFDRAGLSPVHWASIYNRSDLIEDLLKKGAPLREPCRNRFLANGTPLHLAAMNGSIEAASVLLKGCDSTGDWLRERDADGQTVLMRCAAPRTKRMDTVRDLLRKNLWSLSGRPAEIALYLINKGADWRETDSIEGMNLMHLAISNDYEDIVCMLLVIDKKLASIPVQLRKTTVPRPKRQPEQKPKSSTKDRAAKNDDLESVDLDKSPATSSPTTSDDSDGAKALIDKRTRKRELIGKNMLPLQLAIVHGRVNMIRLLWSAQETERAHDEDEPDSRTRQRLQSIIYRVFWSNKHQIAQFVRSVFLKYAMALDLTLIALIWMPVYLDNDEDLLSITIRNGIFVLTYFSTMALAIRVMLIKPGYLRRDEQMYFEEMRSLSRVSVEDDKRMMEKPSTEQADGANTVKPTNSESEYVESVPKVKDVAERVRLLCHKCHCVRRPRSRHCNYCNHCVQDFDHHCIYLGCCIGRKNRLDFLLTIISLTVMSIYGTFIQMNSIETGSWHSGWHLIGFLWIFKYVLIGSLSSFFILKRASHGVTMYEEIRSNRIRKVFGSRGSLLAQDRSKSHKYFATLKGSFWRYSPNRFLTGDLPARKIINNLREYANYSSTWNYLLSVTCADTLLARTITTISNERNKAYDIP